MTFLHEDDYCVVFGDALERSMKCWEAYLDFDEAARAKLWATLLIASTLQRSAIATVLYALGATSCSTALTFAMQSMNLTLYVRFPQRIVIKNIEFTNEKA